MRANDGTRTAGEVLIDQLIVHGVRHVFCVPGESYIAALDAFHDRDIAITVCRHESGAAIMAEAHGKATGRPGICFVTRGPGATNAAAGLHIARQDSTPMILFVGQIARDMREREAFQELDYRAVFGSIAKWATEIDDPARIPELVSRAFYTATSGRPGPVVMALPEDMLVERIAVADAPAVRAGRDLAGRNRHEPAAEAVVGGASGRSCCSAAAAGRSRPAPRSRALPTRFALPVATTFRRAHLFDPDTPATPAISASAPIRSCWRASRAPTSSCWSADGWARCPSQGYTLLDIPGPRQTLVHVFPGVEELGRVYRAAAGDQRQRRPLLPPRSKGSSRRARSRGAARLPARARRFPGLDRQADRGARCGQSRRDHRRVARQASGRRRDLQRRRQFLDLGASLPSLSALRHASSRRSPAPWATACRRRSA